jgi:ribosomal protein S18 acetylase RimI-like enzyme
VTSSPALLERLETYYDTVPRATAAVEDVGPFTLFVRTDPRGWDLYGRPRLGLDGPISARDVERVLDRQRELGVGRQLEWVHEQTPSLLAAARTVGLHVEECPLLTLAAPPAAPAHRIRILAPDSPDLERAAGAVGAGFSDTDDIRPTDTTQRRALVRAGLQVVAAAYEPQTGDVVGGGTHSPRGDVSELTGIAVLPRARRTGLGRDIVRALVADALRRGVTTVFLSAQDAAAARIYERVGFARVGTACIAERLEDG